MADQPDILKILLPDGRNIDICTREGVLAYTECHGGTKFDLFSTYIREAKRIIEMAKKRKCKKGKGKGKKKQGHNSNTHNNSKEIVFTLREKDHLEITNLAPSCFTEHDDAYTKIPQEEYSIWMDYAIEQINEKSREPRWIRTGKFVDHYEDILLNTFIPLLNRSFLTRLAFQKGLFDALGKLVAARTPPLLPSVHESKTIAMIVENAYITATTSDDMMWSKEKVFKKYDSANMLSMYIRCTTIANATEPTWASGSNTIDPTLGIYDELISCTAFIRDRFKVGTLCGDILRNIVNGTDCCSNNNIGVMKKIKIISSFVNIMDNNRSSTSNNSNNRNLPGGLRFCRGCNKSGTSVEFQLSLKKCARCQNCYYCSRECQINEWPKHKLICNLATKNDVKTNHANQQILMNFVTTNYVDIMNRIIQVSDDETKNRGSCVTKSDLLLEVDFKPSVTTTATATATAEGDCDGDSNGDGMIAPALRTLPEFKVKEARGYFEGSRPNKPDWYSNDEHDHHFIKTSYDRCTEESLLCVARFPSGYIHHYQLRNGNMFSNKGFDAVRKGMIDNDYGPLSQIFGEKIVTQFRTRNMMNTFLSNFKESAITEGELS